MRAEDRIIQGLWNRREMLGASLRGMLGGGLALSATAVGAFSMWNVPNTVFARHMPIDPTPPLTEGPYWVDEKLNRSDIRLDPTTNILQTGLITALAFNVSRLLSTGEIEPVSNAYVDIWHASALGIYSDAAANGTTGKKFLRGYQVTNLHGNAQFTTIFPGWYSGRTPHIHFRVREYNGVSVRFNFASQLFFTESVINDIYANVYPYTTRGTRDTTNSSDNIYSSNYTYNGKTVKAGTELQARMFENRTRATCSFNIVIVD